MKKFPGPHVFEVRTRDERDVWHEVARTNDPQRAFSIYVHMAKQFPPPSHCLRWRCGDVVVVDETMLDSVVGLIDELDCLEGHRDADR